MFDLVITGARLVTPADTFTADIGIKSGTIAAIGALSRTSTQSTIDATGLHVLPGLIDTQVHLRDPGHRDKETIKTGTKAAILGGVTTVFDMPNTDPPTLSRQALHDKLNRACQASSDYAFFVGASPNNLNDLADLEQEPGCSGVKIFIGSSTGNLLLEKEDHIATALRQGKRRVAAHCEWEPRLRQRLNHRTDHPRSHYLWRDVDAATTALKVYIFQARRFKRPIHVLHISSAEEIEILKRSRDIATFEVTPQHLTFYGPDCYDRLGTLTQINPPIRTKKHRDALWRAIRSGWVDVIGSDHAPHTRQQKDHPYPKSPSGMPGLQTTLPVMLDHCAKGRLSLERLVALTSTNPAHIYQIANKGQIKPGYDADLVLVDVHKKRRINHKDIVSPCGWTAFHDYPVTGWPIMTILRGQIVMRDGQCQGPPQGRPVAFYG